MDNAKIADLSKALTAAKRSEEISRKAAEDFAREREAAQIDAASLKLRGSVCYPKDIVKALNR